MSETASRTWQQQHARMMRAYQRATSAKETNAQAEDDSYNFFASCCHLKDWLKNDPTVAKTIEKAADDLVDAQDSLKLCANLANGIKHLRADRHPSVDADSKLNSVNAAVYQSDAFQHDAFQTDERIVVIAAGGFRDAHQLADECIAAWNDFLRSRRLM